MDGRAAVFTCDARVRSDVMNELASQLESRAHELRFIAPEAASCRAGAIGCGNSPLQR